MSLPLNYCQIKMGKSVIRVPMNGSVQGDRAMFQPLEAVTASLVSRVTVTTCTSHIAFLNTLSTSSVLYTQDLQFLIQAARHIIPLNVGIFVNVMFVCFHYIFRLESMVRSAHERL
jgi:hypothetical protein